MVVAILILILVVIALAWYMRTIYREMQHLKARLLLTEGGDTGDASFLLQLDNMAEIKPLIASKDAK